MAKLKIGSGIKMEVSMPENTPTETSSTMLHSEEKEACEAIARTQELNKRLNDLGISINSRVSKNEKSIIEVIDSVNKIHTKDSVQHKVIQPEVKAVTIHKDHNDDLKNIQESIIFLEDQTRMKIKSDANKRLLLTERFNKYLDKQKKINTMLGLGLIISTLLHLI